MTFIPLLQARGVNVTHDIDTLPEAPTNLNAEAVSHTQINLSWQDNSDNEDGFDIYRNPDDFGNFGYVYIDSVASDEVTYSDIELRPSTLYYYQVVAFNSGGFSDYSQEASAWTQMLPAPSDLSAVASSSTQIDLSWQNNSYYPPVPCRST